LAFAAMKRLRAFLMLVCACSSAHPEAVTDAGTNSPDEAGAPAWEVVLEQLDGAVLSVWGPSATDIYAVGGPRGNSGFSSLVLHYDGAAWKRLAPGGTDTFWWVHGAGAKDVWMVGEHGRITHWDGEHFLDFTSGTTATLFGVWAASPTDAWAVGGTPEAGTTSPNDVLLHWDGTSWSPAPLPQALGRTMFKIWGSASSDLFVVGEAGTIWHRIGTTWMLESNPPLAHGTLLSVFGCSPTDVYAVGGRDVLHSDGKAWTRVDVALMNDVNGVSCGAPGEVVIVGLGGLKQRRIGGAWVDDFGSQPYTDLHGAWVDPVGAMWGVGGNYLGAPMPGVSRKGAVGRCGPGEVSRTVVP
jgi:hypothetical protein